MECNVCVMIGIFGVAVFSFLVSILLCFQRCGSPENLSCHFSHTCCSSDLLRFIQHHFQLYYVVELTFKPLLVFLPFSLTLFSSRPLQRCHPPWDLGSPPRPPASTSPESLWACSPVSPPFPLWGEEQDSHHTPQRSPVLHLKSTPLLSEPPLQLHLCQLTQDLHHILTFCVKPIPVWFVRSGVLQIISSYY